ncbi:hypothetical protein APASM_2988 [Actinosynnema pretiosum subsp. pretiosum]|nr:hypothetical protein APASM_2988 [Actinosynnema pretiosum subsp. pretiosum]
MIGARGTEVSPDRAGRPGRAAPLRVPDGLQWGHIHSLPASRRSAFTRPNRFAARARGDRVAAVPRSLHHLHGLSITSGRSPRQPARRADQAVAPVRVDPVHPAPRRSRPARRERGTGGAPGHGAT